MQRSPQSHLLYTFVSHSLQHVSVKMKEYCYLPVYVYILHGLPFALGVDRDLLIVEG